jgi:hypothetical protein
MAPLIIDHMLGWKVCERLAAPQRECFSQSRRRMPSIAGYQRLPPGRMQALEVHEIDGVGVDSQGVPSSTRSDAIRVEGLAQP